MRIIQATSWSTKQGRIAYVVGNMSTAKKIQVRLGAKVRAWQAQAAGVNALQVMYTIEFEDWNAFGKINQAMNADTEWQAFLQNVLGAPDPSATLLTNNLAMGLPGLDAPAPAGTGPGPRYASSRSFDLGQGRRAEAIALLTELKVFVERNGGRFRATQGVFTGPGSGRILATTEHDDVAAFGAYQARSAEDAAMRAFVENRIGAVGSPITIVAASTRSEIPI